MADLRDVLHDEIDAREEAREEARAVVEETIRANLKRALEETGDPRSALLVLAQYVEDELTERTTAWFKLGVSFAERRAKA